MNSAKFRNKTHPHRFSADEFIVAAVLFSLCVGIGIITYRIYKAGHIPPAIVFGGVDLILLAGCFDPINTLWFMLPFTSRPLIHRPYSLEHRILRRTGFFIVVAGIMYWCMGKAWIVKIQHQLWHR